MLGLGDKGVINITLVSAGDGLQLKESGRLNKDKSREGISCSFSPANTGSRKWSEKKEGGGPKVKTVVTRKTESVSDGGIKWGNNMGRQRHDIGV